MQTILSHLAAAALYLVCIWLLHGGRATGPALRAPAFLAMALQAAALYDFFPEPGFSTYHVGVAVAHYMLCAMVLLALLDRRCDFFRSWRWLCALAAGGSLVAALPLDPHELGADGGWSSLPHWTLATLAYGMFIVALAQMLEVLVLGRSISEHHAVVQKSLSLLDMERITFRHVTVGFVFLTLAMASGFLSSALSGQGAGGLTHKTLFVSLTWVFCAVLLVGRWRRGWRGTTAILWYAISTLCLVLSYLGTVAVIDLILQR